MDTFPARLRSFKTLARRVCLPFSYCRRGIVQVPAGCGPKGDCTASQYSGGSLSSSRLKLLYHFAMQIVRSFNSDLVLNVWTAG
jgi:hypothetical protein